eukprot:15334269-Ditylum_brightwellii.AAC.1
MDSYASTSIGSYSCKKTRLNNAQLELIARDALGDAILVQNLLNQIRLMKYMHNWLPVHEQAIKFNDRASDQCPFCLSCTEKTTHLFQCMHDIAICMRTFAIAQLCSSLYSLKTAPIVKQVILHHVGHWRGLDLSSPVIPVDSIGTVLQATTAKQQVLGWDNFMKGRVFLLWSKAQSTYY